MIDNHIVLINFSYEINNRDGIRWLELGPILFWLLHNVQKLMVLNVQDLIDKVTKV
ncbi:MAG: hypothetical protein A4E53_00794 [Pelotomaculum sp. PtaB.Bin104]|nr:MAG: hypothetical protein A4E53_00794 [Pelotomaculum sp. PtaB.Bin104]